MYETYDQYLKATEVKTTECEDCCGRGWVAWYFDELGLEKCETCNGEGDYETEQDYEDYQD